MQARNHLTRSNASINSQMSSASLEAPNGPATFSGCKQLNQNSFTVSKEYGGMSDESNKNLEMLEENRILPAKEERWLCKVNISGCNSSPVPPD